MLMIRTKWKNKRAKVNIQKLRNLFTRPESKPREQTFKEVLKELAESSSIHGVPKIVSSRQLAVKILWCLLFFANFGLFINQLYSLYKSYYSYPIQTSMSLEFSSLLMPAVTICNINPIRNSTLHMSKKVQTMVEQASKDDRKNRRKREVNSYTDIESQISENQFIDPSPAEAWTDIKVLKSSTHHAGSFAVRNVEPLPSFYPLHRNLRRRQRDAPSEIPSSTSSISPNTLSYMYSSVINSTNSTYDSNAYGSSSSYYTDSYTDYDWYFSNDWFEWYFDYSNNHNSDNGYGNANLNTILEMNSNKDQWQMREELFDYNLKNENITTRKAMGHQLEDLIMSATFAGRVQNVTLSKYFQDFTSYQYGNCYTNFSQQNMVWRSGPKHGITMTLNLEIDEYPEIFTSGYGVRLVLHEPGTFPLPHSESITLSPGTETNIGLRAVHMSRSGPPHGSCVDGERFYKIYGKTFSTSACHILCRIQKTIEDCQCLPVDAPDEIQLNYTTLSVCNITDKHVKSCLTNVEALLFSPQQYDCQCGDGACKETLFVKTISSRIWPTTKYLKDVLLKELCKKNYTHVQELCSDKNSWSDVVDRYRNNFIRLEIYYESLNYEKITEKPLYEGGRFVSDIGGTLGFFMGASILSFVEFLQLLLEIILFIWRKKRGKNKTKTKVEPLSG